LRCRHHKLSLIASHRENFALAGIRQGCLIHFTTAGCYIAKSRLCWAGLFRSRAGETVPIERDRITSTLHICFAGIALLITQAKVKLSNSWHSLPGG
jgi:hypothetical protein